MTSQRILLFLAAVVALQLHNAVGRLGESQQGKQQKRRSLGEGGRSLFDWLGESFSSPSSNSASNGDDIGLTQDENIPDAYIVRFNSTILSDNELQMQAEQAAQLLGGQVRFIYKHVFQGAAIVNVALPHADVIGASNSASSRLVDYPFTIDQDKQIKHTSADVRVQQNPPGALDRLNQKSLPLDGKYSYNYDGSGVSVYILDTGVRATHAELAHVRVTCGLSLFYGADGVTSDGCVDGFGHGTHVAGIVASATYGVAKRANIVAVKVLDRNGAGSNSGIIAGLDYVIGEKLLHPDQPMVINMSLGGSKNSGIDEATAKAVEAGIVVVVASGNNSGNACYSSPAGSAPAITVAAAEATTWLYFWQKDRRASYSNYGPCVDLFAWGTSITSLGTWSDTATIARSGSSMSCPHVAGAAARYLQRDPTQTPAQVKAALMADASGGQLVWLYQRLSPNRMLDTQQI